MNQLVESSANSQRVTRSQAPLVDDSKFANLAHQSVDFILDNDALVEPNNGHDRMMLRSNSKPPYMPSDSVEVTDANLYCNWRGYTIKKVTDDEEIIDRIMTLHGINDANEVVESTNDEEIIVLDVTQTPTSKLAGKEPINLDGFGGSATKELNVPSEDVDLVISNETPTPKTFGKKSSNLDEVDIIAPKEIKLASVKIEGYK